MNQSKPHILWTAPRYVLLGLIAGFFLGGTARLDRNGEFTIHDWIAVSIVFGILGLVCWSLWAVFAYNHARILERDSNRTGSRRSPWGERRSEEPSSYESRLARFLHCDEEELARPKPAPVSRMKFWSLYSWGSRSDPKPAWYIRPMLLRIHAAVHGES